MRPALAVVVAAAVAVTANWWFTEGRYIQSTDNAYVQGDIAVLGPRIEGDVVGIPVADNQPVHAGDPLILLDPADWQARLEQARAAAAEAAAAVLTARAPGDPAAGDDRGSAGGDRAGAGAADARRGGRRARPAELTPGRLGVAPVERSGHRRPAQGRRGADLRPGAESRRRAAACGDAAQLGQAQARQQNAAAAVKLAENNLSYTVIRAPFDGIVGNRAAELGQHVQTGAQLIAVAPPPDRLYVVANFKETQLRRMRPGMKVRLTADIDPDAAGRGPRGQPGAGHRRAVQPAAAGERDRQLHQGGAARAGEDRAGPGRGRDGALAARRPVGDRRASIRAAPARSSWACSAPPQRRCSGSCRDIAPTAG